MSVYHHNSYGARHGADTHLKHHQKSIEHSVIIQIWFMGHLQIDGALSDQTLPQCIVRVHTAVYFRLQ